MRTSRRTLGLVGATLLGASGFFAGHLYADVPARASDPDSDSMGIEGNVEVALVATPRDPFAEESEVRVATLHRGRFVTKPLASFPHPPGAVARADVARDGRRVFVVVNDTKSAGGDFSSVLLAVDDSGVERLADSAARNGRPLVAEDGLVYVERGGEGVAEHENSERVDHVQIDAVHPSAKYVRTLFEDSAFTLHIAGESHGKLIVYCVRPGTASIEQIDTGSGKRNRIATVAPFARDFSLDSARANLWMTNLDEHERVWQVERLDLNTGKSVVVRKQIGFAPASFALGNDAILTTAANQVGLTLERAAAKAKGDSRTLSIFGPGFESVTHATFDSQWVAIQHQPPAEWPDALNVVGLVQIASGKGFPLSSDHERIEVAGFFTGPTWVAR